MTNARIHLKNVDLKYKQYGYREVSVKSYVLKRLHLKQPHMVHDVHALKDINLDITSGQRVALLGHNGAGKSTLLKTIAGLYPVAQGERIVHGDIRSLFELTLGFEMEATGRENILYRSLLLGLTPTQSKDLEPPIIDFAGLGEFIDYPIKTYSAGMLVRLAFAISTAVKGDILLLDEVIGAGDTYFMEKAKKRIESLITHAKIMVLATHDLNTVGQLCNRALVLKQGEILFDGDPAQAVDFYKELAQRPSGI